MLEVCEPERDHTMSITFNADEIFEIAETIERNAAIYYRNAADIVKNRQAQEFLIEMAIMEDIHEINFAAMRKSLSDLEKSSTERDHDNQLFAYLTAMAELHGTEGKMGPGKILTGRESTTEILQYALDGEKDSIVFYLWLKKYVPDSKGKSQIDKIINEELSHVTKLIQAMKRYT
jgi:rubrerythrin